VYHAIAGAFTEGGQAQANAVQAVTAALGCIGAVAEANKKETDGEEIRVRVAVHVGEKMVAGVLELPVPTFQILGAPFTEAERIAMAGPPMSVMITQPVYELVLYAAQFSMREGPGVRIGHDTRRTYLVQGRDA
jgi:class 3 adenylate cyclase